MNCFLAICSYMCHRHLKTYMLENELPFFPQMFFLIAFPGPVYRSSLLLVAQARSLELILLDGVLSMWPRLALNLEQSSQSQLVTMLACAWSHSWFLFLCCLPCYLVSAQSSLESRSDHGTPLQSFCGFLPHAKGPTLAHRAFKTWSLSNALTSYSVLLPQNTCSLFKSLQYSKQQILHYLLHFSL